MSTQAATIEAIGLQELQLAVQDYQALIRNDASKALAKAARLVTLALHRGLRKQPPRPISGSIQAAAEARGYRINTNSASYKTGRASAEKILSGAKSGYFKIGTTEKGIAFAFPVLVGAKGRIVKSRYKKNSRTVLLSSGEQLKGARAQDRAAYRKLLRGNRRARNFQARKRLIRSRFDETQIPKDAVQLNVGALAVARALSIREKAGRGGYLAAQFLGYKSVRGIGETRYYTKDGVLAGSISIKSDPFGKAAEAEISGFLPGTSSIVERRGLIPIAITEAARIFRDDINDAIARGRAILGGGR